MLPFTDLIFLLAGLINLSNMLQLSHGRVFNAQSAWQNDIGNYNGFMFDKGNGSKAEKIVRKRGIARYIGSNIYTGVVMKVTRPGQTSLRRGVKDSLKPSRFIEHTLLRHRPKFLRY
ncbi:hypothetical protein DdX_22300 [Ditylenchus destructor]|uniref:Uncharacterized protein n=1 Tax=Ditylenchus destructor TaxID=166010 RepID=A0AAD4MI57_9BILA|nr:hypothetical protein DdX_22300 [Ditylenchus destructor]